MQFKWVNVDESDKLYDEMDADYLLNLVITK